MTAASCHATDYRQKLHIHCNWPTLKKALCMQHSKAGRSRERGGLGTSLNLGTLYVYIHATCLDYIPTYMYPWERALASHQYTVNTAQASDKQFGPRVTLLYYTAGGSQVKSKYTLYACTIGVQGDVIHKKQCVLMLAGKSLAT